MRWPYIETINSNEFAVFGDVAVITRLSQLNVDALRGAPEHPTTSAEIEIAPTAPRNSDSDSQFELITTDSSRKPQWIIVMSLICSLSAMVLRFAQGPRNRDARTR